MSDELKEEVQEIKKDAKVQRALEQASPAERVQRTVARTRDKLLIGTHVLMLVALGVAYQLLQTRFSWVGERYPLVPKLVLAVAVIVVCLAVIRLLDVYFVGRVKDTVYQYNLKRVSRLIIWLLTAFFILTILFQNWFTAKLP